MISKLAIHSVPRSGSTWLGELFNSNSKVVYKYQPLFSYAFRNKLSLSSSSEEIDHFFDDIALSDDDFLNQTESREKGKLPLLDYKQDYNAIVYKEVRFHHLLEHFLKTNTELKVIGLVRNPLAVLNSWLNAPKEFRKDLDWIVDEEWQFAAKKNLDKMEEFNGYEKWKEVANLFLKLEKSFPERFKLLKYDDLLKETERVVSELFEFINLEMDVNTEKFIKQSRQVEVRDAYSVYKTKKVDDKWRTQLPSNIVDEVCKDLFNSNLEMFINEV